MKINLEQTNRDEITVRAAEEAEKGLSWLKERNSWVQEDIKILLCSIKIRKGQLTVEAMGKPY